jgi:hypothetical protein
MRLRIVSPSLGDGVPVTRSNGGISPWQQGAAYPVWGVILIALDVLVIYALAMHGREMKSI